MKLIIKLIRIVGYFGMTHTWESPLSGGRTRPATDLWRGELNKQNTKGCQKDVRYDFNNNRGGGILIIEKVDTTNIG